MSVPAGQTPCASGMGDARGGQQGRSRGEKQERSSGGGVLETHVTRGSSRKYRQSRKRNGERYSFGMWPAKKRSRRSPHPGMAGGWMHRHGERG